MTNRVPTPFNEAVVRRCHERGMGVRPDPARLAPRLAMLPGAGASPGGART